MMTIIIFNDDDTYQGASTNITWVNEAYLPAGKYKIMIKYQNDLLKDDQNNNINQPLNYLDEIYNKIVLYKYLDLPNILLSNNIQDIDKYSVISQDSLWPASNSGTGVISFFNQNNLDGDIIEENTGWRTYAVRKASRIPLSFDVNVRIKVGYGNDYGKVIDKFILINFPTFNKSDNSWDIDNSFWGKSGEFILTSDKYCYVYFGFNYNFNNENDVEMLKITTVRDNPLTYEECMKCIVSITPVIDKQYDIDEFYNHKNTLVNTANNIQNLQTEINNIPLIISDSFYNEYIKTLYNYSIDPLNDYIKNNTDFAKCSLNGSLLPFITSSALVGNRKMLYFDFDVKISIVNKYSEKENVEEGYYYWHCANIFPSADATTRSNLTGWIREDEDIIVPAHTYFFYVVICSTDSSWDARRTDITVEEVLEVFKFYKIESNQEEIYNYSYLNAVNLNCEQYKIVSLPKHAVGHQGGDYYDDIFVDLSSNATDNVRILNLETGALITALTSDKTFYHGNAAQFNRNEFYDPSDEYPLLYISSWNGNPNLLTVLRIYSDLSGCEVVRQYAFSQEDVGKINQISVDFYNMIGYGMGFPTYSDIDEPMIMTKWDLNNYVEDANGLLWPTQDTDYKYRLPFMPIMQDAKFINGCIWTIHSYGASQNLPNGVPSHINIIDPYKKAVISVLDQFPDTILNTEMESLWFIPNTENHKYDIHWKGINGNCWKIVFL